MIGWAVNLQGREREHAAGELAPLLDSPMLCLSPLSTNGWIYSAEKRHIPDEVETLQLWQVRSKEVSRDDLDLSLL
eukprot:CAMPEP_0197551478 /NCGR_PEP_ID=MMETSP1320-20131121/4733_1 /TAXON_ID=91990 /ORGANISM="Bolidomonas sp., Strain RCC2347" /LENGTH=75 /DNA_ID=CAMNT_0043111981 /DNA_START=56 /DNA_END=283 /DNA_ORIENTATION=-